MSRRSSAQPRARPAKKIGAAGTPAGRCDIKDDNLRAVEQELASRGLREISTDQLQRFATVLRARIQELCAVSKQVKDQSNSVKSQPT